MKIAILTSICGLTSKLVEPKNIFDNADYYAFVDKIDENIKIWNQLPALDFTLDNKYKGRRNAKIYKVLPHLFLPNYDYWFWVDCTHELVMNPEKVIHEYMKDSQIALWNHTTRNCAFKEAQEIININYDHADLVEAQLKYYKSEGYPEDNGLYELPVSIRKNTDKIKVLNLRWWEQICKFSSRDQISMPFVLWKTNIKPLILPGYANGGLMANPIMPQVRYKGQ